MSALPGQTLDFGPWWWRLRVAVSDRLSRAAYWLDPADRTTTHRLSEDGQAITYYTVRRKGERFK